MTVSYLSAQTPSRSIGQTPYEMWHGQKLNLSHLWEIGCKAFVLVLNKHNPKIYAHSTECTLIGYSPDSKAYWLYYHPSHKIIQSYHVRFIEHLDEISRLLLPGHVLGDDAVNDIVTTPENLNSSSCQKVTAEEELDADSPLPLDPLSLPAAPFIEAVIPPTIAEDTVPCQSSCTPVPSEKQALNEGVQFIPSVAKAVADSCASASGVAKQHTASHALKEHSF